MYKATGYGIAALVMLFVFAASNNCYAGGHQYRQDYENKKVADQSSKSFKKIHFKKEVKLDPGDPVKLQSVSKGKWETAPKPIGPITDVWIKPKNKDRHEKRFKGNPGNPAEFKTAPKELGGAIGPANPNPGPSEPYTGPSCPPGQLKTAPKELVRVTN